MGPAENELLVHYQPIVALRSSRIVGFEALVRWQHPAGPIIAPGEYMPVAEESGLVIPIDRFVLRRACHQIHAWNSRSQAQPTADRERQCVRSAVHAARHHCRGRPRTARGGVYGPASS